MNKLDIIVTFNDIKFKNHKIGFMNKKIGGKYLSYVDQMIVLKKSIDKNWKTFDGNFYAVHSEPVDNKIISRLENNGIIVKHIPIENKYNRIMNRETAYYNFNNSEYSLILDSDIICLQEPSIEYKEDIYCSLAGGLAPCSKEKWAEIFEFFDIEYTSPPEDAYKLFNNGNIIKFSPHLNNGCVLIKNSVMDNFLEKLIEIQDILFNSKFYNEAGFKHFFSQIGLSLAFYKMESRAYLKRGMNFLGGVTPYKNWVSFYHYVGSKNKELEKLFIEYFKEI